MSRDNEIEGIWLAIRIAKSQKKLAEVLGVSSTAVGRWVRKGYVPDDRVKQIHALYGIAQSRLCNPAYREFFKDDEE